MATGLADAPAPASPTHDRRGATRSLPDLTGWPRAALLRPGREVVIVNLSLTGALIESQSQVSPGARAALQFVSAPRHEVLGRVARCRVVRLSPLWYEAAVTFDQPLALAAAEADRVATARAPIGNGCRG